MKKYNVYSLTVIKVGKGDNVRYLICRYNNFSQTYVEVLTNEKIKKTAAIEEEPLSEFYSILGRQNYTTGKPLMLDRKAILSKYTEINSQLKLDNTVKEYEEENKDSETSYSFLEKAVQDFFPKNGVWYSNCFARPDGLTYDNLPCHLRDDRWLAQFFKQEKKLFFISHRRILDFVKNSPVFREKRHEYEQEIVKWQIKFIMGHGENWICDEKYGGDFVYMDPLVDLGIRKGVVDTLEKIGMSRDAIEEGLERNADLWRDQCMRSAFRNEYNSVFDTCFFLCNLGEVETSEKEEFVPLEDPEQEHMDNWIKLRKYEYYQRHKKSVDKYGTVEPEMLMSKEDVVRLKLYLDEKHTERKERIEEYRKQRLGKAYHK